MGLDHSCYLGSVIPGERISIVNCHFGHNIGRGCALSPQSRCEGCAEMWLTARNAASSLSPSLRVSWPSKRYIVTAFRHESGTYVKFTEPTRRCSLDGDGGGAVPMR